MNTLEILWIVGTLGGGVGLVTILLTKREIGNPAIAAGLAVLFAAYTAFQVSREGLISFFLNHTQNLTGVQVWWDLIICVVIILFLVAPRARAVGMNVPVWALLACCTASIALLAMLARLFVLERAAADKTQG